uniref:ORF1 n=1 Tax=American dog tick associated virus-1 TaxID=2079611 RepID=A0A2L0E6T0_9VIRU|nr:ORF1 [American dog tick associated virus-1]
MSFTSKVVSLFCAPFHLVRWMMENIRVLLVISVLMNLTLIPLMAYVIFTDSVNVFAQFIGAVISRLTDTCPLIDNMEDLRSWFDSFAVWVYTRFMDIRVYDMWHTVCFCYALKQGKNKIVGFLPEKAMPGSPYVRSEGLPSFQASVLEYFDGVWREVGQCFRVGQAILTAHHVVKDNVERVRLQSAHGALEIETRRFSRTPEKIDLAFAILDDREFAQLGMAKAKLVPASADCGVTFVSTQTSVDRTSGSVQLAFSGGDQLFGLVRYSGSTRPGYSGAPYYMGKNVYGMHLGAGTDNFGYDAAYLKMVIGNIMESSTDYFEGLVRQAKKKGKKILVRSTGDPDIVEIFTRGEYARVSRSLVDQMDSEVAGVVQYGPEAGNGKGPSAVALGPGQKMQGTTSASKPSMPDSSSTQTPAPKLLEATSMESQEQTPVPRRSRSPSTSRSGRLNPVCDLDGRCSKDVLTLLNKLLASGGSGLNKAEAKLLRQYAGSIIPQLRGTVSSTGTDQPTEKS